MGKIRLFAKIASLISPAWFTSFLISLLIGTLKYGHIPKYGVDGDLHGLITEVFTFIQLVTGFIGFAAVPAWFLLLTHLLINKITFTKREKLLHLVSIVSLIFFFLFKFLWTPQFLWVND